MIRIREVRLIDENGEQVGVVPTEEALSRAQKAQLDLVEVSPRARPPVCKIMDYGKFKYDQRKKEQQQNTRKRSSSRTRGNKRSSRNFGCARRPATTIWA
ncbi:MAG: translation initiation factor IF-3 [Planctomycetota bacterium]|jgi:translation initiation factor IF-3